MDKVAKWPVGETSIEGYYREHLSEVYRFTLSRLRNHEDAEDATQSTFLKALQSMGEGHRPTNASAWLITIARNVCHDDGRRAQRRPQQVALHSSTGLAVEETSEDFSVIIAGLYGLPKRERSVIVWRELEARSRSEIAAKLGIGEKQVTRLLSRARKNLYDQIAAGATCSAVQAAGGPGGPERTTRTRRAFEAHRRWCPRCSTADTPTKSKLALLQPLWLALGSLHLWGRARHGTTTAQPVATVGSGGAAGVLAGKAVLLAAVGAVSGGIVWHQEVRGVHRPATLPAAAGGTRGSTHVGSRPGRHPKAVVVHVSSRRHAAVGRSLAGVGPHRSVPVGAGQHRSASPPAPAAQTAPAASFAHVAHASPAQVGSALPAVTTTAQPGAVASPTADPTPGDASAAAVADKTTVAALAPQAAPPAAPPAPVAAEVATPDAKSGAAPPSGRQANGGGKTAAPGRQVPSGEGRLTAPGQLSANGAGQSTAPGQQNGNGGGQLTAPGQQNGNGQLTAPGQQAGDGDGQPTPSGQQAGNVGGEGQGTAPGQQVGVEPGSGSPRRSRAQTRAVPRAPLPARTTRATVNRAHRGSRRTPVRAIRTATARGTPRPVGPGGSARNVMSSLSAHGSG